MILPLNQTLIRSAACLSSRSFISSAAFSHGGVRCLSAVPEGSSSIETAMSDSEARVVEKIEAAIHGIIVKNSEPAWLPLVPGGSYWVPPRKSSYGIAEVVHKISNPLTEEETLSLLSSHGWPSSEFYIQAGISSHEEDGASSTAANIIVLGVDYRG